jgi:hypothetical protein
MSLKPRYGAHWTNIQRDGETVEIKVIFWFIPGYPSTQEDPGAVDQVDIDSARDSDGLPVDLKPAERHAIEDEILAEIVGQE